MKFSYEDLLSGDVIFAEGIGHFRSPKLKELNPTEGIGINLYNVYLAVLSWDKEDFLKYIPEGQAALLGKSESLNIFDMMVTLKADFREMVRCALAFFIVEKIAWCEEEKCFGTFREGQDGENEGGIRVGKIDRENFDAVRDMALQMNYVNLGRLAEPKHASAKAKKYWDLEQQKRKEALKQSGGGKYAGIGNLISKLCAAPARWCAGRRATNFYESRG